MYNRMGGLLWAAAKQGAGAGLGTAAKEVGAGLGAAAKVVVARLGAAAMKAGGARLGIATRKNGGSVTVGVDVGGWLATAVMGGDVKILDDWGRSL